MNNFLNVVRVLLKIIGKIAVFFAKVIGVLTLVGAYDVSRNTNLDGSVVKRYFLGNGALTWLLSPLNAIMDVLALPFVNKGVYTLEELPAAYQSELKKVLDASVSENLIEKLEEVVKDRARTMVFFKWYGENVKNSLEIPAFHDDYKYVQTIGVSVFNKKQSTSKHFGPFRATLRVLYNINQMTDASAYITVGNTTHYWKDEQLFIFDDTLMHQSINETSQTRYCMFIDILRPSLLPGVFKGIVGVVRYFLRSVNYIFYKNWDVVES